MKTSAVNLDNVKATAIGITMMLLLGSIQSAQAFDDHRWRFGGSAYGVKTWFWVNNECKDGPSSVRIKLVNTKPYPVEFQYRINNAYWVKKVETKIPANSSDSSFVLDSKSKTCRVKLDQLWGKAE